MERDFYSQMMIILKKMQRNSASLRTSLCPLSKYCLMKMEIVWTERALIYSELVSHHKSSSLIKQLINFYSLTLL